jgi:hypothetical protein
MRAEATLRDKGEKYAQEGHFKGQELCLLFKLQFDGYNRVRAIPRVLTLQYQV